MLFINSKLKLSGTTRFRSLMTHDARPVSPPAICPDVILPGATLGILGSGQLGRMFAQAAARLGYRVHVYSPNEDSPAGQVANQQTVAAYSDIAALTKFAQSVAVVTLEFENISTAAADTVAQYAPVRPSGHVLHIAQNRLREKRFLEDMGIDCAPFADVTTRAQLAVAINQIGLPAVLKTADSGYDGKGQTVVHASPKGDPKAVSAADAAWDRIGRQPAILEGWIDYQCELSVLVARSPSGELAVHGPIANDHENHILDISTFPLAELESCAEAALEIGRKIATALDLVGFACVEFFLTKGGRLLVNEIAPRPHNSGHLTIDASTTSQFEQQVRAICGLPLGSTEPISAAAMVNLLGDLWQTGEPCWRSVLADPHVRLHLYGKAQPRPGRKMGHLTVLADTAEDAAQRAQAARRLLVSSKT